MGPSAVDYHARRVLRPVVRGLLRVSSAFFPVARRVVVYGYPDTEGNATETVRALLRHYGGRVIWLTGDPCRVPKAMVGMESTRLTLVKKDSIQAIWHYLRSEAVFFTHGLYGDPRPSARKPLVNLWHGNGPKDLNPREGGQPLPPCTYAVGSSELFTRHRAHGCGVPQDRILITGNPRTDQLSRPTDAASLRALGIEPGEPFVVWMPTFRKSRDLGGTRGWVDSMSSEDGLTAWAAEIASRLRDAGVALVVKPHPLDAEARSAPGAVVVDDERLHECGVELYELLGASAGLVTDYSSVWVDYLLTDRPMSFLTPDRQQYAEGRGLWPSDVLSWLPGITLESSADIDRFVEDVLSGGKLSSSLREATRERVGLNVSNSAADDLVRALLARHVLG